MPESELELELEADGLDGSSVCALELETGGLQEASPKGCGSKVGGRCEGGGVILFDGGCPSEGGPTGIGDPELTVLLELRRRGA